MHPCSCVSFLADLSQLRLLKSPAGPPEMGQVKVHGCLTDASTIIGHRLEPKVPGGDFLDRDGPVGMCTRFLNSGIICSQMFSYVLRSICVGLQALSQQHRPWFQVCTTGKAEGYSISADLSRCPAHAHDPHSCARARTQKLSTACPSLHRACLAGMVLHKRSQKRR